MVLVVGQQLAHVISIETTAFYTDHTLDRYFRRCGHPEDTSLKLCLTEFAASKASKNVGIGAPRNTIGFLF